MTGLRSVPTAVPPLRRWYLMFTDEDGGLRGLLGPFKGGKEDARVAQQLLLHVDETITKAIDFEDPELRVPYLYHNIQAIDLTGEEIAALEKGGI
jgi:hypothetical protein